MAGNATPVSFNDLIGNVTSDNAALVADNKKLSDVTAANAAALKAISDTLTSDTAALTADSAALSTALIASGPVFIVNPDGSASFYVSDNAGSYHVINAQPATITLPPAQTNPPATDPTKNPVSAT